MRQTLDKLADSILAKYSARMIADGFTHANLLPQQPQLWIGSMPQGLLKRETQTYDSPQEQLQFFFFFLIGEK